MKIKISRIVPNPQQPRKRFDESGLAELAASMKEHGLLHNIVVEEGAGAFILIDGERRWRAAKLLGWAEIESVVRPPSNGSGQLERTVLALVANLQRKDLDPVEEARAYQALTELGLSNAAIAHQVGVSLPRVASRRALLELPEEIQDLCAAGLLPIDPRCTRALLGIPEEHRVALARKLARPGLKIVSIQKAAEKLDAALSAGRVKDEPALHFAHRQAGRPDKPNWDALHELGKLPPWAEVTTAAHETCASCALRGEASHAICGQCPAVALLAGLIEASHEPVKVGQGNGHR